MTPYYEEPGITIYHGDCREILPMLRQADAVVTDPPYGIAWGRATWPDRIRDYDALMCWLVAECQRLVPHGWCFVFQAMPNVGQFHAWFPPSFRLFAACKNFAQIRPTGVWYAWDPVVFWANGEAPRNTDERGVINRDYHVGNVAGLLRYPADHPCPRPLDTMRHIVGIATLPGMRIVDPFMGSGTTLVAAKDLGRDAIGIEINEASCEIAVNRLR